MTGMIDDVEPRWKHLLQPWKIAVFLMAIFLASQAYFYWQDRPIVSALNDDPKFSMPEFPLEFSTTIQYDPLTFVGRGARAGFWDWTPEGLVLTEDGSRYFGMEGDRIVSHTTAGRRRFSRLRERVSLAETETVHFFYLWEEISAPAVALLFPPPKLGDEYRARAELVYVGGTWQVSSVESPDFDEPLQNLQSIATGVLH